MACHSRDSLGCVLKSSHRHWAEWASFRTASTGQLTGGSPGCCTCGETVQSSGDRACASSKQQPAKLSSQARVAFWCSYLADPAQRFRGGLAAASAAAGLLWGHGIARSGRCDVHRTSRAQDSAPVRGKRAPEGGSQPGQPACDRRLHGGTSRPSDHFGDVETAGGSLRAASPPAAAPQRQHFVAAA